MTAAAMPVAGMRLPGCTALVERGPLRAFARAICEPDPVFQDEAAARAAGHASLPVPPTYLFCLEMLASARPLAWLEDLGVDLLYILHGEQRFVYDRVAVAGETLTFDSMLKNVFDKKNGALRFFVKETRVTDEQGSRVAELTTTIVVRQPA